MSWQLTPWGLVCRAVADDLLTAYSQFTIGIGPDPESLQDMGPRITFVVLDGTFTDPRYGGSDETAPTFDEELPIRINIHVPTTLDTANEYDTSPLLAESVKERLLEAIDSVRHVPYLTPHGIARRGGRTGEMGTTIIISASVRLENCRTRAVMATPIKTTMALGVAGPDNVSEVIEVINAT
jgi:hypothetical protein